jgi:superfamily II DNA or RNA helicase
MRSCTLYLKDEVNCQFKGLDAETRRKCSAKLKFFDPKAKFSYAVKMGRWDGKKAFFNAVNGETYINLLDRVIETIESQSYHIEIVDQRINPALTAFAPIDENYLSDITWPPGHRLAGQPVILEEHQVRVINALLKEDHAVVEAATGAGKSAISAALGRKLMDLGRMIVVVPGVDLVTQTADVFKQMGVETGMFYGKVKELNKHVTICTWQSLNAFYKKPRGMDQLTPEEVEEVLEGTTAFICDEAHTCSGEVLKDLFTKQLRNIPIRWGLTGTIPRDDINAIQLETAIGPCVLRVDTRELQDTGFLAESEISIIQLEDKRAFTDYHAELDALLTDNTRMSYIADFICQISAGGNTLVLIDRVAPGENLTHLIQTKGINAEFVSGKMKNVDRKDRYKAVQSGMNTVTVATYGVASTGIDIQRLHNVVFIEAGKAFIRVIQSLGRGLRKGSDKDKVDVFDICSSTKYSNRHKNERCKYYREKQQKHIVYKIKDWK